MQTILPVLTTNKAAFPVALVREDERNEACNNGRVDNRLQGKARVKERPSLLALLGRAGLVFQVVQIHGAAPRHHGTHNAVQLLHLLKVARLVRLVRPALRAREEKGEKRAAARERRKTNRTL